MKVQDLKTSFQYGMHGCGYFKGTYHVNTLESLRYWRSQGVKVMEIDMAKTCDERFVALAHLMTPHYLKLLEINSYRDNSKDKYSENWFMRQRLCSRTTKGLTPMNLSTIIREMDKDPELIVMFDLWRMWGKEDTKAFSNNLIQLANDEVRDRCLMEVYNKNMLDGIREADPKLNIMYCVHAPQEPEFEENVNPEILKKWGIDIISYPWAATKDHPGEMERYKQTGFTVFSLTETNKNAREMKKAGVNVNLVDVCYTVNNFAGKLLQRWKDKFRLRTRRFFKSKRKEMTIEEVHGVSLEMMKEIHEFCVKNDIKYSLAYGSLIGAIRHKGFIPWDDDIDVWMTRPNFEKFSRSFRSKSGLRLSCIYDRDSLICFNRIYETDCTYVKHGIKSCDGDTGIWIDIMPLDGVPDDSILREQQYGEFVNLIKDMKEMRLWLLYKKKGGSLKMSGAVLKMLLGRLKRGTILNLSRSNAHKLQQQMISTSQRYEYDAGVNCCYFQCGDAYAKNKQELLPIDCFDKYQLVEFEDTELMIIKEYDRIMKSIYGDYMKLPPEKDRKKSHGMCFWKN